MTKLSNNATARIESLNPHETVRILHWHRPQENRVQNAEDRGVHADGESKAQHRERTEARRPAELRQAVMKIATEVAEETDPPGVSMRFLDLIEPAELESRSPDGLIP